MNLSVIICTHNPREDYLRRALEALRTQTLPKDQWELLLIDNASKDILSEKWDLSWHPAARHIREEELGLTPARLRGIREAEGDLLVFVDDDNVLDPAYLQVADELMSKHPNLGCIGAGRIIPEFEEEPAEDLRPHTSMLALREIETPIWSNTPDDRKVPWGAGLVVQFIVAEKHHSNVLKCPISRTLDRSGQSLNSCGDDEFSWTAATMGYGKGIFPELVVLHLIDKRRLQKDYLLRIAEGHAFSHAILRWKLLHEMPTASNPPKAAVLFGYLLRGRISAFFSAAGRWWTQCRLDPNTRAFNESRAAGVKRAADFVTKVNHDGLMFTTGNASSNE